MTDKPTPTDAEIEAVVQACRERGLRELDVFRTVVAKFGTPALVGREPVAVVVQCHTPSGKRVALYSAKQDLPIGTKLYTAPQPSPAPVSEMPYEKRKAIQEGEQIGASDAWFHARHNMLDTLDRRNVFRAGFDRGWTAAIAAQGGK